MLVLILQANSKKLMKLKIMKAMRYSAQLIGFQLCVFFIFFLIGEGASGIIEGKFSALPFVFLMIFGIAGFIVAMKKASKGAIMMILSGVFMGIYLLVISGFSEWKMCLIFTLPFVLNGLMFYGSRNIETIETSVS